MEFKYINDRTKTPNRNIFSSTVNCDSPFRNLPNFSTPPSRFTKIRNPFETHLIERLHLPTFSPSVFSKVSTPNDKEKFRWTIDEISSLKPADIDEDTISQHVQNDDPHIESIVQQKIETFFSSEQVIVPSPLTDIVRVPLITDTPENISKRSRTPIKKSCEATTQTVLTLPPVLPEHVEEVLRPFFTYTQDQQQSQMDKLKDTSFYRDLFEFDNASTPDRRSVESSPALSTGLSPIQFNSFHEEIGDRGSLTHNISELRECTLSPILGKSSSEMRSACRLDFSSKSMSIDASLIVPDIGDQMTRSICIDEERSPLRVEPLSDSTINWDMEYNHVSLASQSSSSDSNKMDISSSNSNTPHSRIFISQRKRLSDSFKDIEDDNAVVVDENNKSNVHDSRPGRKMFKNENSTDAGYHTVSATFYDESFVFASTPSKRMNKM